MLGSAPLSYLQRPKTKKSAEPTAQSSDYRALAFPYDEDLYYDVESGMFG